MSWDPVVDDRGRKAAPSTKTPTPTPEPDPEAESETEANSEAKPESESASESAAESAPPPPPAGAVPPPPTFRASSAAGLGFSADTSDPAQPEPTGSTPDDAPVPAPSATAPATPSSGFTFSHVNIEPPVIERHRPARLEDADFDAGEKAAAPVPDRPATSIVPSAPAKTPAPEPTPAPAEVRDSTGVPTIVEATPVREFTDEQHAEAAASNTNEIPMTPSPRVDTPVMPATKPAPAPTNPISLPAKQTAPAVPAAAHGYNPHADMFAPRTAARQSSRKSGSGIGVLVVLLLLVGLVAAGIVYGRPYLFPEEWDASAKAYAADIEAVRGVEFVDPLAVVSEPTSEYRARVGDQLLGEWEAEMPMWRALGLAAGGTERDVLDSLIINRSPAIYSTVDGQVYHDAAVPAVDLDAHVTLAMAVASLDQEFVYSAQSIRRAMLDEAMIQAHVAQQASTIQQKSSAPTEIHTADDSPLAFLPPVLDYRLVAPTVFAELLPAIDDVEANPLADVGAAGPGPLSSSPLTLAPAAELAPGESLVGTYRTMDRGFWYLSFATHTDAVTARRMSTELSAAALGEVSVNGTRCFSSVFETSTPDGVALLANDLNVWAAATAPELQASVALGSDGTTVQVRTCDPGDAFTSNARFGVGRDLIAWEATELATVAAVIDAGGSQTDIDAAMNRLQSSDAVNQVLDLDLTASATEVAAAARNAISGFVAAPAVAIDQPAEG